MAQYFVLKAAPANDSANIDRDGTAYYYNGRAGGGWVSKWVDEAFLYQNAERAAQVAANFNRFTSLHGLTFVTSTVDR
jgi:hypothetical protein